AANRPGTGASWVMWHRHAKAAATGSVMVGFGTTDQRLPGGFRLHSDGKNLSVSGKLAVGGARIPVSATVALGVSGSGISVSPVHVGVPGVATLPSAYSSQLPVVVPLSALPPHLRLPWVHVPPDGRRIGAAA